MNQGEKWNKKMGGRSCFITSGAFGHGLMQSRAQTFHRIGPLGRFDLVVAKSVVCLSVCLSPFHAVFLK